MGDLILIVLLALASYRLTRIAVEDTVADAPRAWLEARLPAFWYSGLTCYWCLGTHISGAVAIIATLSSLTSLPLWLTWLAVATLTGIIAERI